MTDPPLCATTERQTMESLEECETGFRVRTAQISQVFDRVICVAESRFSTFNVRRDTMDVVASGQTQHW